MGLLPSLRELAAQAEFSAETNDHTLFTIQSRANCEEGKVQV